MQVRIETAVCEQKKMTQASSMYVFHIFCSLMEIDQLLFDQQGNELFKTMKHNFDFTLIGQSQLQI